VREENNGGQFNMISMTVMKFVVQGANGPVQKFNHRRDAVRYIRELKILSSCRMDGCSKQRFETVEQGPYLIVEERWSMTFHEKPVCGFKLRCD
jgi:hypothetical protein